MKHFISTHKNSITITLLITVLINIVVMRIFDAPLKNKRCESGIVSYELAKDLDRTVEILNSWDINTKINASLSLGFDFLFLLVYSSFIAVLIFNINQCLWKNKSLYKLGNALIISVFIAAIFDMIENAALIRLLLGDVRQVWSSIAYYFAMGKFGILLICIIYLLANWVLLLFLKIRTE